MSELLPVDSVTEKMSRLGSRLLVTSQIARMLREDKPKTDWSDTSVVDAGTGSGILAAMLAESVPEIKTIFAFDKNNEAIDQAKRTIRQAIGSRATTSLTVESGDWNNPDFMRTVPSANLYLCNPPFLVDGQLLQPGYELVDRDALYAGNQQDLEDLITHLSDCFVSRMRNWDSAVIRLPRKNDGVMNWPQYVMSQLTAARAFDVTSSYTLFADRYDQHTDRPGHVLYIQRLPGNYPHTTTAGDFEVDIFQRTGERTPPEQLFQTPDIQPGVTLLQNMIDQFPFAANP